MYVKARFMFNQSSGETHSFNLVYDTLLLFVHDTVPKVVNKLITVSREERRSTILKYKLTTFTQ